MKRFSWHLSIYLIKAALPYLGFAWLLLSVIVFVQQAARYTDIFFNNSLPNGLVWQLTLALLPNVVAFTCPMAALIGVVIGLSKVKGDSELVAIRAAGVGNLQITLPMVVLGLVLSGFALFVNIKGVPFAAQIVRRVALQTAIYKLESPIEPGVFNSEIQGNTIYVKDGELERGIWKNIFIYQDDKAKKQVRLITSQSGRLDTKDASYEAAENSELVLNNATVNTFSLENLNQNLVIETVKESRFAIKTRRGELLERLSKTEETPEEMGLSDLSVYANSKAGKERTEVQLLLQRRIILSFAPLFFAILGAAVVLRFNRGGRGWGIFLALVCLIAFYLVTLLTEQLAQTDKLSVLVSGAIPPLLTIIASGWFFLSQRLFLANRSVLFGLERRTDTESPTLKRKTKLFNLTTGILDFDIVWTLAKYFALTLVVLMSIYTIFTAFSLWKFAGNIENGLGLLLKYLLYLVPFVYIQISPTALMIATLATYVIKSRNNEIVTWTAAGRSIYRLLLPCFVFMMLVGFANWGIQERLLAATNIVQDNLRTQIRNQGIAVSNVGKQWLATGNRIYSFELMDSGTTLFGVQKVKNLAVYQFADGETRLQSVTKVEQASWEDNRIKFSDAKQRIIWDFGVPKIVPVGSIENELNESYNPFKQMQRKPMHLTTAELKEFINTTESDTEKRSYSIALQRRYATLFLPLILTLFAAPFALTLSHRGNVVTIGYAVLVWLIFTGVSSAFEQYGLSGNLDATVAVWSPLIIFTLVGGFLLTRVDT